MTDPSQIKAIVTDIDGVLTDGYLIPLADGDLLRKVDAKDSFALRFAAQKGLITGIISGGATEALRIRCLSYGIAPENLYLGCRGKLASFDKFCSDNKIDPAEVMYFGDDVADIQVLRKCGIGVVPGDAADEAKEAADIVSDYPGGRWCVRKGIEMVMKAQGKWAFDENEFQKYY